MSASFSIPWHRYALIAYLAQQLGEVSPQFGKTALQKDCYLLQEVFNVPIGYRFTLYNYGPYSQQLTNDLSIAEAMDAVTVSYVQGEIGGYVISEGDNVQDILEKGQQFISEHDDSIQKVVKEFGEFSARKLELYTTTIYVVRDFSERCEKIDSEMVFEAVNKLKPYFSEDEIYDAIEELGAKGLIDLR